MNEVYQVEYNAQLALDERTAKADATGDWDGKYWSKGYGIHATTYECDNF